MDTEERIRRRREQYRLRKDRETPEESERRRCRNRKCGVKPKGCSASGAEETLEMYKLLRRFEVSRAL